MPLAKDLVSTGFSAGQARGANGQRNSTISAAGTTQGTATLLTVTLNYVSTVAANSGVILFNGSHSDDQWVFNGGANVLTVYPPVGGKINGSPTNTGIFLGLNTGCIFKKFTDTQWTANLSA